jgi:AcrR family transcriptional regulator
MSGRGLPKGSTSNYFRTRAALLIGVVERLLERELPEVGSAFSPASLGELGDALCALFACLTGPNRVVTTARLVLFREGATTTPYERPDSRPYRHGGHRDPCAGPAGHAIPSLLAAPSPPAPKDCSCTRSPHDDTDPRPRSISS